jgi:hypothetical protein
MIYLKLTDSFVFSFPMNDYEDRGKSKEKYVCFEIERSFGEKK